MWYGPFRSGPAGLLALALAFAGGCGDDGSTTVPPRFDAGPRDGSGTDGTVPADGGPALDAGDPSSTCTLDGVADVLELGTDVAGEERRVALAPASNGVLAVWAANDGGGSDVFSRRIPSAGAVPDPVDVTDDFHITRAPGVARVGTAYLAAWIDNAEGSFEVRARPLDGAGAPAGDGAVRVTTNALREDDLALVGFGAGALLAWVDFDDATSQRTLRVQRLDADGQPVGSAAPVRTGTSIAHPALAADGDTAVLGWVDGGNRIAVQALDATGAPAGTVQRVDAQMNAAGTVDVAYDQGGVETTGGAVTYGVNVSTRSEVRFRHLDATGTADGSELPLASGRVTGAGPSVAAFRGGFVASFRVLSDPELTGAAILLVLFDNGGARLGTADVASTLGDGARTTVQVGLDGHLGVGWSEREGGVTTLRAARLRCGT